MGGGGTFRPKPRFSCSLGALSLALKPLGVSAPPFANGRKTSPHDGRLVHQGPAAGAPGPFSSVPPLLLRGEFGQGDNDKRRTSFLSTHVPQKSPGESRHVSMAVTGSVIGPGVTAQRSAAAGAATRLMCRREAGSSAVCSVTSQHGKRLLCARR